MRRSIFTQCFAIGAVLGLALLVGCSGGTDPGESSTGTTAGPKPRHGESVTGHEPVLSLDFTTISQASLPTTDMHVWTVDSTISSGDYPAATKFTYWVVPYPEVGSTTTAQHVAIIPPPPVAGDISAVKMPIPGIYANPIPKILSSEATSLPDATGTNVPSGNPSVSTFKFSASPKIAKGTYMLCGTVTVGTVVIRLYPTLFVVTD